MTDASWSATCPLSSFSPPASNSWFGDAGVARHRQDRPPVGRGRDRATRAIEAVAYASGPAPGSLSRWRRTSRSYGRPHEAFAERLGAGELAASPICGSETAERRSAEV
jgi:hypothetical protein